MAINIALNRDVLQEWKQHTTLANEFFRDQRNLAAQHHYSLAISAADRLLNDHSNFREAIETCLISYQNMAELYSRQNEPDLVHWQLTQILEKLSSHLEQLESESDKCGDLLRAIGRIHTSMMMAEKNQSGGRVGAPSVDGFREKLKTKLN